MVLYKSSFDILRTIVGLSTCRIHNFTRSPSKLARLGLILYLPAFSDSKVSDFLRTTRLYLKITEDTRIFPKTFPNNFEVLKKMIMLQYGPSKVRDFGESIIIYLFYMDFLFSHWFEFTYFWIFCQLRL